MLIKKSLTLSKTQQLVDLNEDLVNFELTFTVTSHTKKPFNMIVVDQSTLDNNPNLEFKNVDHTISGDIISDKNIYQNYFLCLKADTPCDVDVEIEKKEIPPNLTSPAPTENAIENENNQKSNMVKYLAILGIILLVCGFLYYMYTKKNKDISNESVMQKVNTPFILPRNTFNSSNFTSSTPIQSRSSTPSNSGATPVRSSTMENSLFSRLNNLEINGN